MDDQEIDWEVNVKMHAYTKRETHKKKEKKNLYVKGDVREVMWTTQLTTPDLACS